MRHRYVIGWSGHWNPVYGKDKNGTASYIDTFTYKMAVNEVQRSKSPKGKVRNIYKLVKVINRKVNGDQK